MTRSAQLKGEAMTIKIGAVLLPLGVIMFVVSTAVFHPHEQDPMNNPAVFMEYARSDGWIAIHFVQWFAALFLIGGLVSVYYSITAQPDTDSGVARFGFASAVVTATTFTLLQAVDEVALKWAVDTWATAPPDEKVAAFFAAQSLRWTEYALQSYSNILLGLTLILYGIAMITGTIYPGWLGWLACASGIAWIIHGVLVPYIGFFDSMPRLVAIALFSAWSFIMAVRMWHIGSGGHSARFEATS